MRQILRQLLVGLHAEEVVVRQRAQRREVDARLLLPDPDEVPVRPGLRRLFHKVIFDAALQRADEAEQRMRNVFQIVRHGLRLRRLGEALKVRAVRDEARLRLRRAQPLRQRLGGRERHVRLSCQLQLHRVHQRRVHQPAVGRVAIHTVVDEGAVRHKVDEVDRYRRIHPEHRIFKSVLFHFFADEFCDLLLIDAVDESFLIEKRQHRRQRIDRDILLRMHRRLLIFRHQRLRVLVAQRGDDGRGRVKIQNFRVRDAAHDLLLAGRDRKPRRCGKANDLFHSVSSRSARAALSFSAASCRRCSTQYGSSSASVWPISSVSLSCVTSSKAIQCFCPM